MTRELSATLISELILPLPRKGLVCIGNGLYTPGPYQTQCKLNINSIQTQCKFNFN